MEHLFDVPRESNAKKPTLAQFLKTHGKKKLPAVYPVITVWEPGQFPNFTFETEQFRVRISENNPAFGLIRPLLDELLDASEGLGVSVDEKRDGSFALAKCGNGVTWERLGDSGYRIKH